MRTNATLVLATMAAALATTAAAQMNNPVMGSGTPSYPTATARGGENARWPSAVNDYKLGLSELKEQKYRDAAANFRRVLRVAPREAKVWRLLGLAEEGAGRIEAARDAYAKAVELNATDARARQGIALTALKLGDKDEARAQLAELQKRFQACDGACADADELKFAVAAVEDAIADAPDGPPQKH